MMDIMEVRKIIAFGDTLEHLPECMKDLCENKALYVLVVKSGPKKGCMYLICEECFEKLKFKHPMIPLHTN